MRGNSKQQQQQQQQHQSSDDLDDFDGDEPYHNMNGSKPNNLARRSNNTISNNTRKQQQQQSQQDDVDVTSGGLNAEQTAALAALFMAPGLDPEERISMFHVKDGTRVTGSKAPKRGDLTRWLNAHPGFLPDESEIMNLTLKNQQQQQQQQNNEQQRLRRKSSLKPIQDYAETSSLEDEELAMAASSSSSSSRQRQPPPNNNNNNNINNNNANNNKSQMMKGPPAPNQNVDLNAPLILFNKLTNKKLSGQKVPNWKVLAAFLDKNEQIYIDPTCNELVRAKYGGRANVPDIVKSRMINLGSSSSNKSNMNKQPPPPPSSQTTNSRSNTQTNSNSGNSNNRNSSKSNSNGAHHHIEPPQDPSGFNPFELQGLTELLAASGAGQFDMNNPLAGFMAAALAAQGQAGAFGAGPGMPPGAAAFNPFLMPPFGATGAAAATTPDLGFMAELLSKMPPGKRKDEFYRGLLEFILYL